MRISAVSNYSSFSRTRLKETTSPDSTKIESALQSPSDMAMISFKSGNPRHIAHVVSEEPLFGFNGGGVGTVVNDYNFLDKDAEKIVKLIPLYNQDVQYKEGIDPKTGKVTHPITKGIEVRYIPKDLPSGHPYKAHEGMPFVTGEKINNATNIAEFLQKNAEKNNIFLLEEVKSSNMNWGMEENIPIKMFKAKNYKQGQ